MALSVVEEGIASSTTSGTTLTITIGENFNANWMPVAIATVDNSNTNGAAHSTFTCTDSKGNTWTRRASPLYDPGTASSGVEGAIFTTEQNAGVLTSSDTVTITVGTAATMRCASLAAVKSSTGKKVLFDGAGVGTGSNTLNPTVTTTSLASGTAVIIGTHVEWPAVAAADGGGWTEDITAFAIGTGATGLGQSAAHKITASSGTVTFNGVITSGTAQDCVLSWIAFVEQVFAGTLTANVGNVTAAGQSVGIRATRAIAVTGTNISVAGVSASLTANRRVIRPSADSIDGNWTTEIGGTDLYASIDETDAGDADYIQSPANPVNEACKVRLSNPALGSYAPQEPMVVAYRYAKSGAGAALDFRVRLMQGNTEIASWTETDIGTGWVTQQRTLTTGQFNSITDFTDLYLEFMGTLH